MAGEMTLSEFGRVVLIGAGRMGGALARGWLAHGLPPEALDVVDPRRPEFAPAGWRWSATLAALADEPSPDVIVLATKPQQAAAVLEQLGETVARNRCSEALLVSIAAGVPLAALVSTGCRAVRAMPNLAAEIGRGITALTGGRGVDERCMEMARALFLAVGETVTLTDEKLLDAVTAVSGSGPAYLFAFTQALEAAARREGLPAEVAARLARATVSGSAALLDARPDASPARLSEEVTSPGGTTAAALAVFGHNHALRTLMEEAVRAAHRRAVELGREVAAGLRTGKPGGQDDGRENGKPGDGLGKGPSPGAGRDE